MYFFEPVKYPHWIYLNQGVVSSERRIAHEHIEARFGPAEHIREGQFPVEGGDALLTPAQPLQGFSQLVFQLCR